MRDFVVKQMKSHVPAELVVGKLPVCTGNQPLATNKINPLMQKDSYTPDRWISVSWHRFFPGFVHFPIADVMFAELMWSQRTLEKFPPDFGGRFSCCKQTLTPSSPPPTTQIQSTIIFQKLLSCKSFYIFTNICHFLFWPRRLGIDQSSSIENEMCTTVVVRTLRFASFVWILIIIQTRCHNK